jgi:hypothetical protein
VSVHGSSVRAFSTIHESRQVEARDKDAVSEFVRVHTCSWYSTAPAMSLCSAGPSSSNLCEAL